MGQASWRRNFRGGAKKHLNASGRHKEASRRHLESIWEASGRPAPSGMHLGSIWEGSGIGLMEASRAVNQDGGGLGQRLFGGWLGW